MSVDRFIDQSNASVSIDALVEVYSQAIGQFGFTKFSYTLVSGIPQLQGRKPSVLLSNYSQQWLQRYMENKYIKDDPVYIHAAMSRGILAWKTVEELNLTKRQRTIIDERKSTGLENGLSTLIRGPSGEVVGVNIANDGAEVSIGRRELSQIHAIMNQFHLRYTEIQGIDLALPRIELSPREKDVLTWASLGKSNSAIATIMGISQKTVEFHLSSIFKKLEVNSRILAVLKAINLRLISP